MGPAPMIRMVEMSVLLGIKSHGREMGTKKGRACRASLEPGARLPSRAGWSLDQILQPRKGLKDPINRHLGGSLAGSEGKGAPLQVELRFRSCELWRGSRGRTAASRA